MTLTYVVKVVILSDLQKILDGVTVHSRVIIY